MEQSPETAPTPSNGENDAEETIVIKKPAAASEGGESVTKDEANVKNQTGEEIVAATIKVEKKTDEPSNESETEEVIVEEVEETETSTSESEKDDTEVLQKEVVESVEKKESVAVAHETVAIKEKVAVESKESEASEEEEVVEEEIEEAQEEQVEEKKEEEEKTETSQAETGKADEKDGSQLPVSANVQQIKQVNVNNTIKEIISDIDSNIREQERIASLKQEELKLLQKQHELAQQIKEQQLLAQRLVSQNDKLQQQYEQQQQSNSLAQQPQQQQYQQQYEKQPSAPKFETLQETSIPQTTVSKYSTFEETKDGNVITKKTSSYEAEESSNVTKRIDLQKIFTPATDAEEILPRNRKLYASSAFYTPGLHPTVEDQVELARRISHSLSDISNHQSKGQSMYVNRKKRSVKWVHEGQDFHTYQPPKPPTSPSIVPAYSDVGKHRVQLNLHQEQVLEKYARPGLQVVKSPWEAALETGSASAAFVEGGKPQHAMTPTPSPAPIYDTTYNQNAYSAPPAPQVQQAPQQPKYSKPSAFNDHQKDLAYKPSLPQGWKAPSVSLPKELYMPKEIPIESYAPPPVVNLKPTSTYSPIYQSQDNQHTWTPAFSPAPAPAPISPSPYNDYSYSKATPVDHNTSAFPVASKPAQKPQYGGGVSNFPVSANVPPKQQYWEPTSYQKVHQPSAGQKVPQVNFNPSPLPYDKLAKFENPDTSSDSYQQQRYLAPSHGHGSKVRNASPAPFATRSPVSLPYSPTMQQYSNYGSTSYSPSIPSSTPTYGHHNPNELLHGPTFNTAARGWKSPGGSNSFYGKPRAPLTTGGHMPYTDF